MRKEARIDMKRETSILLSLLLIVSLVACGSAGSGTNTSTAEQIKMETDLSSGDGGDASSEAIADANESETQDFAANDAAETASKENDILIVYFSAANMNDVDAVSSATPIIDGASSVEWIAGIIQEETGAEIVKIVPTEDYPLLYDDVADAAKKEADNEVHPDIQPLGVNPTTYKTVFIGYPMWWYRMPMVLETFFDIYDFSGVTIVPFNTHEGSRDGGTYDMICDREPDATVLDGIAIRGGNAGEDSAREEINAWLAGLDLE